MHIIKHYYVIEINSTIFVVIIVSNLTILRYPRYIIIVCHNVSKVHSSVSNTYSCSIEVIIINEALVTSTTYRKTENAVIFDSIFCERITVRIAKINSSYIVIDLIF
jgi:hypothetical protein